MKRALALIFAIILLLCGCAAERVELAYDMDSALFGGPMMPPPACQLLGFETTPEFIIADNGTLEGVAYQVFFDYTFAEQALADYKALADTLKAKLVGPQPVIPDSPEQCNPPVVVRGNNGWNDFSLAASWNALDEIFIVTLLYSGAMTDGNAFTAKTPISERDTVPASRGYICIPPTSWGMTEDVTRKSLNDDELSKWKRENQPAVIMLTGEVTAFGIPMNATLLHEKLSDLTWDGSAERLRRAAVWASYPVSEKKQADADVESVYAQLLSMYGIPNSSQPHIAEYDFTNWNDGSGLPERGIGQQIAIWRSPDGVTQLSLQYHTPKTSTSTGLKGGGYQIALIYSYIGLRPEW